MTSVPSWEGERVAYINRQMLKFLLQLRVQVVPHFSSGIVGQAKRERAWKLPRARKGDTRRGERKMRDCRHFLSPWRVSPFLAWGDFHGRSRFARFTIPEEKWGTTRSLLQLKTQNITESSESKVDIVINLLDFHKALRSRAVLSCHNLSRLVRLLRSLMTLALHALLELLTFIYSSHCRAKQGKLVCLDIRVPMVFR